MAVLLVTYELKTTGKDYEPFYNAIKNNSKYWWHYLEHVWIVETSDSADAYTRKLFPHITQLDRLLVFRLAREHQGWLPKDAWDWLNNRTF